MKWPWYRKDRQLIFRVPPQPPVGHGAVSTPHQDQAVVLEMDEVRGIAENDGSIFIGLYKHGQLYWWARTSAGQPEIRVDGLNIKMGVQFHGNKGHTLHE